MNWPRLLTAWLLYVGVVVVVYAFDYSLRDDRGYAGQPVEVTFGCIIIAGLICLGLVYRAAAGWSLWAQWLTVGVNAALGYVVLLVGILSYYEVFGWPT